MKHQQGSFILLCLVIISLLAGLSLMAMHGSIQTSRLVHSYLSYSLALNRAETALSLGESGIDIESIYEVSAANKPLKKGLFPVFINSSDLNSWQYINKHNLWLDSDYCSIQFSELNNTESSANRFLSSYIVEKVVIKSNNLDSELFRVTAIGFGLDKETRVILQSMVKIDENKQRISWLRIQS